MHMVAHTPWEWSLFCDGDAYYLLVVCGTTTLTDVVIALSDAEIAAWQQTKMTGIVVLAHHRTLWLARNRSGGLEDSLATLTAVTAGLAE
jgi:hypothetical protein